MELLNLADTDMGGAEMIGSPVHARLWDSEGNLREPFARLVDWYLTRRPFHQDPMTVAAFVVRIAAMVSAIEAALEE